MPSMFGRKETFSVRQSTAAEMGAGNPLGIRSQIGFFETCLTIIIACGWY